MNSTFLIFCFLLVGLDLVYGKGGNKTVTEPPPLDLGTPPPPRNLGENCRENTTVHSCTGQGVEPVCSPNGTCVCILGYVPDGSSGSCKVQYRSLGETCREKGQTHFWYFCGGAGVEVVCPASNKCQCKPGYEPAGKTGGCKIAAPKTECTTDVDCTGAWTQCQKGTCTCLEGFQARKKEGGMCDPVPNGYHCPNGGKPLTDGKTKTVQLCEADFRNDSCPQGFFCNYWPNSMSENHGFSGHCCPRAAPPPPKATPKTNGTSHANSTEAPVPPVAISVCPVGVPHKTGICPDLRNANVSISVKESDKCPLGSEYGCTVDGVCCPRPCRSNQFFFNYQGQCLDRVAMDSPCKISTQCVPGAECADGTCQCQKGYKRSEETCSPITQ